jgi:large repetitive protein
MSLNHQNNILRSHGLLMGAVLLVLAIAPSVSADRIIGVTATTNMGSGFGTNLINTVNGVGLSSPSLTATHAGTIPPNSWVSTPGTLTGQITFSFGGLYSVNSFSFWNQNGGGPGEMGTSGIRGVQVLTSTDGIVFTPLVGGPLTFAQVTGSTNLPPEIFSFAAVNATHFRFMVLSNWGETQVNVTGFGEVGFNGAAAVPEPATMLLLGSGLTGFAARALRRRKTRK